MVYTYVESRGAVGLGQHHVCVPLELAVETLEKVLKQQGNQLTRELQTLVPVVVLHVRVQERTM